LPQKQPVVQGTNLNYQEPNLSRSYAYIPTKFYPTSNIQNGLVTPTNAVQTPQSKLQVPTNPVKQLIGQAGHQRHQKNFMSSSYTSPDQKPNLHLMDYDPPQYSTHANGIVKAFAGNTYKGLYRNYNEDRVILAINCPKPATKETVETWPRISFFGIYDGHNGHGCAEYMKNALFTHVIDETTFPSDVQTSLLNGFEEAEKSFFKQAYGTNPDKSGTCAVVTMIVEN
jgi:hypothetical protein